MSEIGYAVVIADQLDKTRSISFQFNFAKDATATDMGAEVDKLVAVMDRQRARAQIHDTEQFIKAQKKILGGIERDMKDGEKRLVLMTQPDATRRNPPNVAKQLEDNIEQQKRMIVEVRDKIAAGEEELELLKQKAA